jgi:hypothetical protein
MFLLRFVPMMLAALLLGGCYAVITYPVADGDDPSDDDDADDDDDTTPRDPPDDDDDDDDDDITDDDDTTPPSDDDDAADEDDIADDDDTTPPPGGPYCYTEPGVDPTASLSDLSAGYSASNWAATVMEVTDRRYPSGNTLLTVTQSDSWWGAFTDSSSWTSLMDSLMTMHHEQTHYYDYANALFPVYFGYFIREDWQPQVDFYEGFPRAEIYSMLTDSSTDLYSSTYLVGGQGSYGFMELLDEHNCYINGLAALSLVGEYIPFGLSGRDGAVAFTYYLELYLQRARNVYPSLHADICGDPDMRDLILVQWLRMHYFLQFSDAFPNLGIYDVAIEQHMYDPALQWEIENCIGHTLQADNCLPAGDPWTPPWQPAR